MSQFESISFQKLSMVFSDMEAFDAAEMMFQSCFTPSVPSGRSDLQDRRKLLKQFLDSREENIVIGYDTESNIGNRKTRKNELALLQ